MKLFIKNKRSDGKYTVTYSFDNGVHITKILTAEKLQAEQAKSDHEQPSKYQR